MATKKVVPAKAKTKPVKKAVAVRAKKAVVTTEAPVNFPVKSFVIISLVVFAFVGLFLIWWSFLNSSIVQNDPNSWIYSRHKYDKYQADGCGGDPLVTLPQCPR